MGKGGGGSPAPQTSTVNQSNLPEYARPYFEDLLQRGQTASQVQYQPYGGERTAGFSPLQEQGFQGIQGLGPSSLNAPAAGLTGVAGLGGLGAGQNYAQQATSPGSMQAYMSPYMQNVVDFQKSQAVQDYGRQLPGQQAAASRAGAFGGSRQAIVESEAQRNLQNTLGGIQAQGSQQAFEQANKNLQFGSQLGLQGLGLAGQMGQQLGQLGQTAFGQQAAAAQAQQAAGATQQAQSQDILNKRYEDFMQQLSGFYPTFPCFPSSLLLRPYPRHIDISIYIGLREVGLKNLIRFLRVQVEFLRTQPDLVGFVVQTHLLQPVSFAFFALCRSTQGLALTELLIDPDKLLGRQLKP